MRTRTKSGIIGCGIAFAGSAALAAFTPVATAAGSYNSVAVAQSGALQIEGQTVDGVRAPANPQNSPQNKSINVDQVESQVKSIPSIGPALVSSLKAGTSGSVNVVVVAATASSSGTSGACAAALAASCSNGKPTAINIKLGLTDLDPSINSLLPSLGGVLSGATSLAGDDLELSIIGPEATCTAGPSTTTSGFTAAHQAAVVQASLVDSTGTRIGSPVTLRSGDIFSQLGKLGLPTSLSSQIPLAVQAAPGSASYGPGTATASTGALSLSDGSGKNALNIANSTVTCGPNTPAANPAPTTSAAPSDTATPSSPAFPDATASSPVPAFPSATPTATSSSNEKPLTKIQTDEGRSKPGSAAVQKLSREP